MTTTVPSTRRSSSARPAWSWWSARCRGALDGKALYKGLGRARNEVHDGIAASLDYARQVGMPLAIEPLHPMQAADRAYINTGTRPLR